MGLAGRLDRLQRRFPVLGYPLATIYKFFDDNGSYLGALITYYTFVSLFPMLLLASTVLGVILVNHPDLQRKLLDSALSEFPVIGEQLKVPQGLKGSWTGVIFGALVAAYGAQGAAQAFQHAANTVWQVPRNTRPNPFQARGRSVLLLATAGLGLLAVTVLNSVIASLDWLSEVNGALVFLGTVAINAFVFVLAFILGTTEKLRVRDVWIGATVAGLGWQALQAYGVHYVDRVIRHASTMNALFAVVLGMLAFLYLSAVLIVLSMEVNVVKGRKLYPRALLTPFTDNVDLTPGDQRTYTGQAQAERHKGFQQIKVSFKPQDKPDRATPSDDPDS